MSNQQKQEQLSLSQPPEAGKLVAAECLMGGRASIQILHKGQVYLLSLTRNDKLILTK